MTDPMAAHAERNHGWCSCTGPDCPVCYLLEPVRPLDLSALDPQHGPPACYVRPSWAT